MYIKLLGRISALCKTKEDRNGLKRGKEGKGMEKSITTVIFDMDGTLLDTEKYFRIFWRRAAAAYGYEMSDEQALFLRSLGRPYAEALLKEWFGESFDYFGVREYRRRMMEEALAQAGLETKPYAKELLTWLKDMGYRTAVATATPAERAREQLREVSLERYFDEIVSAAQVERGKPSPDVYLYACEKLGAGSTECLAVEDSPNGVLSAVAAGLKTVMIPDQTQPDEALLQKLYACVPSLLGVKELL